MNLTRTAAQNQILGKLLSTAQGRQKLAASLGPSLRRRRDYQSIARKALMVETLPDGALPIYDKEFDATGKSFVEAFIIGEEGQSVVSVVKPNRITVPTFEIAQLPMIPITQIKERRFDVVQRAINLGKAEVGALEDGHIFSLLDAVAVTANAAPTATDSESMYNADQSVSAPITVDYMADAFAAIENHDLPMSLVFFNPRDYADLRKWTQDNIDRETERKLLKTGQMGFLWGATLLQSRKVAWGTVYLLAEAEFLGVLPERVPLTVMSADRPDLRQIGFSLFEIVGFTIFNPSGVVRLIVARS